MTEEQPPLECALCRRLPASFNTTDGDLSEFPAAGKLEKAYSCGDGGSLPEHALLRCPVCGSWYLRSSHATMTGGEWETTDSCRRLGQEEMDALKPWSEPLKERGALDLEAVRGLERLMRKLAGS